MLARMRERGTLLRCWCECQLLQPLWKTVWSFLRKLKIEPPYDPAIALLGIYPKDTNIVIGKDTCTPMFIAMSTIVKLWKEPRRPLIDEWIKNRWYMGRLGGSVVERLPSAQGVIPESWDQAPHRAPPL